MMETTLDSKMIVNPFDSPKTFEKRSQSIADAASIDDPIIMQAIEVFRHLPDHFDLDQYSSMLRELAVLTPMQIDNFVMILIGREPQEKLDGPHTGKLISDLIMRSYYGGNNDFIITTGDCGIAYLPSMLYGDKYRRLCLTIEGLCYKPSKLNYCNITIKGHVSSIDAFDASHNSNIIIYGNTSTAPGIGCMDCEFTFHGDAGPYAVSYSERCTVTFYSKAGNRAGFLSKDSVFRATRKDTFDKMVMDSQAGTENNYRGNVFQLIKPDGTVLEEVSR